MRGKQATPDTGMTDRDLVDVVTADWRKEMPDLDQTGVELTRRVMRLAGILERQAHGPFGALEPHKG